MIQFFLLVNKQGQTRLSQYYEYTPVEERVISEAEIIRRCLSRVDSQCSIMEHKNIKVVYRRYASLFFIVGVDSSENELGILEFIHSYVEILDGYFESVIMFNIEKAHMILDEMIMNGEIVEFNRNNVMYPLVTMEKNRAS